MQSHPKTHWPTTVRALGLAAAAVILWLTFRTVEVDRVQQLLVGLGLWAIVIPVPQLVCFACETLGWKQAFALLGRGVRFLPLLRVRVTTDALTHSLPGGVVWCESAAAFLLKRHCGIPFTEGIAGLAARKYLLLVSQAAYVLLIFLLGYGYLQASSPSMLGGAGLQWVVLGVAAVLAAAAYTVAVTLQRGAVGARLHALLWRVPAQRWRSYLERRHGKFVETDGQMARFFGIGKPRLAVPALPFLAGWLCESVETYLILRLLGVNLDFAAVASFEVLLAFVRHTLVFLPAGLGVQDAGYAAFLAALGVPNALSVGAAFVLLKRSKEVLWAAMGYGLLLLDRKRADEPRPAPAAPTELGVDSA